MKDKVYGSSIACGRIWNTPNSQRSIGRTQKNIGKKIDYEVTLSDEHPHEARLLKLDCSKAHVKLEWKDAWRLEATLIQTTKWYKDFYERKLVNSERDLKSYVAEATKKKLCWSR